MKRRDFLGLSVGGAVAALSPGALAQAPVREIRIGYQKTGVLVITRQQAILEKHFAAKQVSIKWIEFTSGPPLLEAMSTSSVDLGAVGDTPPIFAQAANANIVYVAGSPITNGQGILVPANSGIRTIADLRGKRIGFAKGTSAHNVLIATLEKAGLTYEDITPVYLSPPDAGPAFANGSIEAWAACGGRAVGGGEPRCGGQFARRGDGCPAGSADRRGQPRVVRDRSGDGGDHRYPTSCGRPLLQARPDPEADRGSRHRLAPYPDLNSRKSFQSTQRTSP